MDTVNAFINDHLSDEYQNNLYTRTVEAEKWVNGKAEPGRKTEKITDLGGIGNTINDALGMTEKVKKIRARDYAVSRAMPQISADIGNAETSESIPKFAHYKLSDGTYMTDRLLSIAYMYNAKYGWSIDRAYRTACKVMRRNKFNFRNIADAIDWIETAQVQKRQTVSAVYVDAKKHKRRAPMTVIVADTTQIDAPYIDDYIDACHARANAENVVKAYMQSISIGHVGKVNAIAADVRRMALRCQGRDADAKLLQAVDAMDDKAKKFFKNIGASRRDLFGDISYTDIAYLIIKYM